VKNLQFQPSLGYLAPAGTLNGFGVFASRAIEAGEVIEVAPVVQLRSEFDLMEINLQRRVFDWERLASLQGVCALALGYGSMYNHANPANMRYVPAFEGDAIKFIAARAIDPDEELTINYDGRGGEPFSTEDIWFNMCDVVPIVETSEE
jgi:SET domain-containing protein